MGEMMKLSLVVLCLAFAFTGPIVGAEGRAEDLKPHSSAGVTFPRKRDGSGVDNFYQLSDGLYSGSKPHGEEGFRFLGKLGIKTILSVDGPEPDVALARKYGIRYVHVPLTTEGIQEAQAVEIVKAAREQPGPLYVHCHYGMNRGPSAAAIICIAECGWTTEQAVAWMKRAGTSSTCEGLYRDVRKFKPPAAAKNTPSSSSSRTGNH